MKRRADGRFYTRRRIAGETLHFYGETKREVESKIQEAHRKANSGVSLTPNKDTLEQYLSWWLDMLERSGSTAPSTVEKYQQDFTNHVYPLIGARLFTACNPSVFADFMRSLRERKSDRTGDYLSKRTMRNIRAALRSAFNDESAKRYHPVNPLQATKIPASLKADDNFEPVEISPETARQLIAELSSSRYGLAFRYMVTMGFREGETLAIRKQDIDLERGTIKVTGSVRFKRGKGVQRGETKTEAAKATLPLPPSLIGLTRAYIDAQRATEAASVWLFPTKSGKPVEATNLIRYFKSALARLGLSLDIRVQDLRRYVGTQVAQRVSPKDAQKILRHANISTTYAYYIDGIPDEQRRALDELDSMMDEDRVIEMPRRKVEG
jgi:integrase